MFTDMVGYTHLSQVNESLAVELLHEQQELIRPNFATHGGTEVKAMGDGFLVEFKSALDAVTCAIELQKRLGERNADSPTSRRLELRIGIHVGDVVHEKDDIYGDAVNVASRIEPLADPGGICISQQVYDQIRNKVSLPIEKVGDVRLKNVDLPLRVYKIKPPNGGISNGGQAGPRERLAVLPFVNISPDPRDEYFADGLTEELIAKLSEIKNLKVIARTSVISYKRTEKKISEIAEELGVGSIIEGSVRKAGNRVRISVQLIDARTQEHLWSANYDSQLDDIFAIQTDVASKVADSLSATVFSGAQARETESIEAYTLYLKAMQLSYDMTEASIREVVALLQRAIERDPKFARAYAALADAWHALCMNGYDSFEAMTKKSEVAAKKALELDPGLAEAHSAMATVDFMLDRFDAALVEAETAVRINPNLAESYMSLGVLEMITRTPADALRMFRRGYELDPLSTGAAEMVAAVARLANQFELSFDVLERTRELNPKNDKVYLSIADHYMESGNFEESQKMIDLAKTLAPDDQMITVSQALLFALSGQREEAETLLKEVRAFETTGTPRGQLLINAALGNVDEGFKILMHEAEIHSWPFDIQWDPIYAELRKDPRFPEFCKKVGIKPTVQTVRP